MFFWPFYLQEFVIDNILFLPRCSNTVWPSSPTHNVCFEDRGC